MDKLQNAYVTALPSKNPYKNVSCTATVLPLFLYAHVFWQHYSDIILFFVKIFGQGTNNVCQPSCFDKRH